MGQRNEILEEEKGDDQRRPKAARKYQINECNKRKKQKRFLIQISQPLPTKKKKKLKLRN